MHSILLLAAFIIPGADNKERLEPWASKSHPQDVVKKHVQEIQKATETYRVMQSGTMLNIDESTGLLSGMPDLPGSFLVEVTVTLERAVRHLENGRLSWGHEHVLEIEHQKIGSMTRQFQIRVTR